MLNSPSWMQQAANASVSSNSNSSSSNFSPSNQFPVQMATLWAHWRRASEMTIVLNFKLTLWVAPSSLHLHLLLAVAFAVGMLFGMLLLNLCSRILYSTCALLLQSVCQSHEEGAKILLAGQAISYYRHALPTSQSTATLASTALLFV